MKTSAYKVPDNKKATLNQLLVLWLTLLAPGAFVISLDGRYIATAGAISGHLGVHAEAGHCKPSRQKNTQTSMRTGYLFLYKSLAVDLLYRLHPCRRPFGLASLMQKRSWRFCHFVQLGHIVYTIDNKKGHPYRSGLFYYIKAWQ